MIGDKRSASHQEDTVKIKRLKKLVLPSRKKSITLNTTLLEKIPDLPKTDNSYECPLCLGVIHAPFPPKIKRLIKKIKQNQQQYFEEKQQEHQAQAAECRAKQLPEPPFFYEPADISLNDKKFFCRTHKIELIFKPMAKERGYPGSIDFDQLKERLVLFKHDLESIIDRQTPSSFLELAQNEFKNKGIQARNAIEVMKRFEQTLPGYYGHKGSNAMMDTLSDLFLKTGYLDDKKSEPLKPIEFVQQVLVPECGIRLIQQDLRVSFEEAKKVMRESEEYGSTVYS